MSELGIAGDGRPEGECVFVARDEDEADWFIGMSRSRHPAVDVWEVTLEHDLDAWDELPPHLPYDEINGYLCVTEPIPAERVRLLREGI
jgi:hypothetical protein